MALVDRPKFAKRTEAPDFHSGLALFLLNIFLSISELLGSLMVAGPLV